MDREAWHVVVASREGNRHDAERRSWISLADFQTRRISRTPSLSRSPNTPSRRKSLPKVLILFPCGSPTSSLSAHHSLSLSLSLPTFLRPRRRAPAHDSSHLSSSMLDFHALSLDPMLVYNGVILDPTIFFPRTWFYNPSFIIRKFRFRRKFHEFHVKRYIYNSFCGSLSFAWIEWNSDYLKIIEEIKKNWNW